MYLFETHTRVRYAETDQMGYVYYGNYATYYEVARVEAFRALGFPYRDLEAQGIMMPVLEMQIRYHQPARYDDLLTLKLSIKTRPSVRIVFDYEILNEAQTLLNTGQTTLVFVQKDKNKILRCPEALLQKLAPYFAAPR
ncbi:MAG: thioesterase family protein [Microscillaceae bacterium]